MLLDGPPGSGCCCGCLSSSPELVHWLAGLGGRLDGASGSVSSTSARQLRVGAALQLAVPPAAWHCRTGRGARMARWGTNRAKPAREHCLLQSCGNLAPGTVDDAFVRRHNHRNNDIHLSIAPASESLLKTTEHLESSTRVLKPSRGYLYFQTTHCILMPHKNASQCVNMDSEKVRIQETPHHGA